MDQRANEIPIGIRFKMSELGGIRCPRLAQKVGIVVGRGIYKNSITVLFDGNNQLARYIGTILLPSMRSIERMPIETALTNRPSSQYCLA